MLASSYITEHFTLIGPKFKRPIIQCSGMHPLAAQGQSVMYISKHYEMPMCVYHVSEHHYVSATNKTTRE